MNIHNMDFAYIGLTVARIASQLKKGISINQTVSFGTDLGTYVIISLFEGDKPLHSFHLSEHRDARDLMDAAFAFCMDNNVFKVPMDITLVD